MAPTRPATNGPTPKSAPTTENNGVKKTSEPSEQQLYVVSRQTNDPEGVHGNHEVVGTFKTLAAANAAARDDLIKGWGREYFETYEASEVDGMVHVIATCPDGEEMVVLVEKSGVRKATTPPPKSVNQYIYTVRRKTVEPDHDDGEIEVLGAYETLAAANEVARNNMIEEWGEDFFEEFEVMEVDGMVCVDAVCPEGESMTVRIEKIEVMKDGMAKKAAAPNQAVRAPREITVYHVSRHIIDYHNDQHRETHETDVVGTYFSLAKANKVARRELLEDYDRDYFDTYDEEVYDGMVIINATCGGGEDMNVYVERGTLFTGGVRIEGLDEMEEWSEGSEDSEGSDESDY